MIETNVYDLAWGQEIKLPHSRSLRNTPHVIGGRYPCRSIAYIPQIILRSSERFGKSVTVLDPFMGSGTTAIEACKHTNRVWGLEVDPYARLIATVATRRYPCQEQLSLAKQVSGVCAKFDSIATNATLEPSLKNIRYWFDKPNYNDLLKLKSAIFETAMDEKSLDFLLSILGDIVRPCSKAERQSLKPYISRKFPKIPKSVLPQFKQASNRYLQAISITGNNPGDGISWGQGDATRFKLKDKIHVAITSPPYINAIDYVRCVKLESAWVGTGADDSLLQVRSAQLGEEVRNKSVISSRLVENLVADFVGILQSLDGKRYATVLTFFQDMFENLQSVNSVLRPNGEYFLIIGNSRIRDIEVPTHKMVGQLAEQAGFSWINCFNYRIKDHRTSIPRHNRGGKIDWEHVIHLRKSGNSSHVVN